jgi:uncharacterized protein (DUF2147 family)
MLLFWTMVASIFVQDPPNLEGIWLTTDGKAKVEITQIGNAWEGTIIWLKDPLEENGEPKLDQHNPDPAKKPRPIIGTKILTGFARSMGKPNRWDRGEIYDPENGKTYACHLTLSEDGKRLKVRGFVGFSMLGRTEVWTLVTQTPSEEAQP